MAESGGGGGGGGFSGSLTGQFGRFQPSYNVVKHF